MFCFFCVVFFVCVFVFCLFLCFSFFGFVFFVSFWCYCCCFFLDFGEFLEEETPTHLGKRQELLEGLEHKGFMFFTIVPQ